MSTWTFTGNVIATITGSLLFEAMEFCDLSVLRCLRKSNRLASSASLQVISLVPFSCRNFTWFTLRPSGGSASRANTSQGNHVLFAPSLRVNTDFVFCSALTSLFRHQFELMYTEAAYFFHSGFPLCQIGGDQNCALDSSPGPKRTRHQSPLLLKPGEQPS